MGENGTAGGHQTASSDAGTLEHDGVHSNDGFISNVAGFEDGAVADSDTLTDRRTFIQGHVDHAVVLHVALGPDDDCLLAMVCPKHRTVPNARVLGDDNVADKHGGGSDERVLGDARSIAVEFRYHSKSVGQAADPATSRTRWNAVPLTTLQPISRMVTGLALSPAEC
jgi:hypothetical protein